MLEMEEAKEMPLILGRPFLATTKVLIDMEKGNLTLQVGPCQVTFFMYSTSLNNSKYEVKENEATLHAFDDCKEDLV